MKKTRTTFGMKLYSIFMISVCVPFLIASIGFMIYYNSSYMKRERQSQSNLLQSVSQNIEAQFQELINIGNTFYMQKEIFQMAECWNNPALYQYYGDVTRVQLQKNYVITMVKQMHMSRLGIRSIAFFPMNPEISQGYEIPIKSDAVRTIEREVFEKEDWYQKAVEADGAPVFYPGHQPVYYDDPEEVYSLVRGVRNMDNKKIIGVLKIDARVQSLKKSLDVVSGQRGGLMLTTDGTIACRSATLPQEEPKSLKDGKIRIGGKIYMEESLPVSDSGWTLSYLFYQADLFKGILYAGAIVVGAMVLSMALAFWIYSRQSRSLVQDVQNIKAGLEEIETGNLDMQVPAAAENELQGVADAINHMAASLKRYIEQEYLLVINQQKAEYSALQAQINPHFLYNTLNGFVGLNRMGEKEKLEESIISLTHLFRYTCKGQDITTLCQEFSFLEEYLKLEKLKYEERLEYMIWLEESCLNLEIPRLLLQPVVENSIVHGMGDSMEPLTILLFAGKVKVKGIGELTVLSVRDNGEGFEVDSLDDLKDKVGVINVQERAQLYCKNVICQVLSKPGIGTVTTMVFPEEVKG